MYICVYVYVRIHMYTYVHICMYMYTCVYIHVCIDEYMCVYMCIYTHVNTYNFILLYLLNTVSNYVLLASLTLSMQARLTSDSWRPSCLCLERVGLKDMLLCAQLAFFYDRLLLHHSITHAGLELAK